MTAPARLAAADYTDVDDVLTDVYGGAVFAAHVDMLREHLGEQ